MEILILSWITILATQFTPLQILKEQYLKEGSFLYEILTCSKCLSFWLGLLYGLFFHPILFTYSLNFIEMGVLTSITTTILDKIIFE